MEKEFYSKVCVAESIKFTVNKINKKSTNLQASDKFSCNLATILARDKEVVAVKLTILLDSCTIYISKNNNWLEKDDEYIRKIERYLRSISNDAPITMKNASNRDDVQALFSDVMAYCSVKFDFILKKLKKDIDCDQDEQYIIFFKSLMIDSSIDINNIENVKRYTISKVCYKYYKQVKNNPIIPENFLLHLKKLGSYYKSLNNITKCMCKELYKGQISHLELRKLYPTTTYQTISPWNNIIQKFFTNHKQYEDFKNTSCLKNYIIEQKLKVIYGDHLTTQLDSEIRQDICLHAEMNILTNIIDQKDKSRAFIAVSKNCCYLCKLYIDFAQKQGYNIVISGSYKKIYHTWKLPDIKDSTFWMNSLSYMLTNINQIINNEIQKHIILSDDISLDYFLEENKSKFDAMIS